MKLVDVYSDEVKGNAIDLLWKILFERPPHANISHKYMPPFKKHVMFVENKPYKYWYLIEVDGAYVGAIYLGKENEIGIGILKEHQRKGYGKQAIKMLMETHQGPFLANVAPGNEISHKLFQSLGGTHIQCTYKLEK